jgi:NosR/NirI family nitrous oxide reductase transcriptional regulator
LQRRCLSHLAVTLVAAMGWGMASVGPATAAGDAPAALDCASLPCGEVLPGAVRFESVAEDAYWVGHAADGSVAGWVALSTDFVDIQAYSGKPLVTLVGLDPGGIITGAKVVHHSEPILLVGIPESALHEFVAYYAGKRATDRIVVGKTSDPDTVAIDAISGATVTVLAQNHTILESARTVGVKVGVLDAAAAKPGRFVSEDEPWSFAELVERGALGRLTVSEAEMGVGDSDRPFVDLYFGVADAPHIGRALLAKGDYDYYMSQLTEGEHLFVVLGRGSGSFKGSGFVRGGIFDRVRLSQGLREISFRDTDYYNLTDTPARGAPQFDEGAVFVARGGLLDPGAAYDLIFLGSRYDRRSAFSREFREFKASHRLPESVYRLDRSAEEAIWRQAWSNRQLDAIVLTIFLLFVVGVFAARSYTTADPARIQRLHLATMIVSFLLVGVYLRSQPSVTQVLTLIGSALSEWRWSLFLSEPLVFIFWIFITAVSLVWGRGVFCGWVCPYGAMTELLFKITTKLGIKSYELPDAWHMKLRYVRYAVLFVLIPAFLWDSALGERLAEVEPFKSTFLVPAWERPAPFFGWWVALLLVSTFMYRPFCRYLCPLGGGLALFGSFRFAGPRRRRFCTACKICTRGCEPRAIRPDGTIDARECLSCMDCEATYRNTTVCPPLVGIEELANLDVLTSRQSRKLADLKVGVKDV